MPRDGRFLSEDTNSWNSQWKLRICKNYKNENNFKISFNFWFIWFAKGWDVLSSEKSSTCRPFRLTCAIARTHVSTHANLSAHAICRTHEKSYSAEKVLFHWVFFFQSLIFVYECHLGIMRYMSIAIAGAGYNGLNAAQNRRSVLPGFFVSVFSFVFFRTAQAYTSVYYIKC